ncbi:MAG: thiamine pyrophosphate-dependent enzyme, partial [[Clostridium] leptum]
PYTVNKKGHGPAWQNSLFEDNAEFGFGMALGQKAVRGRLAEYVNEIAAKTDDEAMKKACAEYIDTFNDSGANRVAADALIAELEKASAYDCEVGQLAKKTLADKDFLAKKSMWIFGGDGWAYDIGFGGLDHVIASGENVNILVFDTEVYSNTGGQASKATPVGSVAQFAAAGKATKKKDLAGIAMSYGYVYVAQVAMGADYNQCIKAFTEAESYNGPSIIIAYAPCINHGIKGGMGISQAEEKKAVAAGYWNNFRFDPRKADNGENPFTLDSKAPTASYRDFIMGEVRYNSLTRAFPERAEKLFEKAEKAAADRYEHLVRLQEVYGEK